MVDVRKATCQLTHGGKMRKEVDLQDEAWACDSLHSCGQQGKSQSLTKSNQAVTHHICTLSELKCKISLIMKCNTYHDCTEHIIYGQMQHVNF